MLLKIIAYVLGSGLGYLAGTYLPENPATPYIPLLLSYHIFLFFLVIKAVVTSEQKVGLSSSLPMAFVTHLACVGAMIGMVMGRHAVPAFGLLQYVVPGLAPFELKWVFEGKKQRGLRTQAEHGTLPECTNDEYQEFLNCLKRGERKFQTAGRTVHDEYAAWLQDRRKRLGLAEAAAGKAKSARTAQ